MDCGIGLFQFNIKYDWFGVDPFLAFVSIKWLNIFL